MSLLTSLVAFGVFGILLFAKVEFWGMRFALAGIVAGLYFFVGSLLAMVAAVVLSIGILIHSQMPTVSRL